MSVVEYPFRNRRDTTANWELANPVLLDGQIAIALDAGVVTDWKYGNGVDAWLDLPSQLGIPADQKGAVDGVPALDADAKLLEANIPDRLSTAAIDERARDAVGTAVVAGPGITKTVDDGGETITLDALGADALVKSSSTRLVFPGDSFTLANVDLTQVTYPNLIGQSLPGVPCLNLGVGGHTSTEVAITVGAVDLILNAFTMPASGSVAVTLQSSPGDLGTLTAYTWVGVVGATPVTVVRNGSTGVITLTRTTAGSSFAVAAGAVFHATRNDDKRGDTHIIWAGRNNYTNPAQVVADIDKMIARLTSTTKRYLVLSVMPLSTETTGSAGGIAIATLNAALSAAYGTRYVDLVTPQRASGLAFSDLTEQAADTTALGNGTIPPSLMTTTPDVNHPNMYGFRMIAKTVLDRLVALGWVPAQPLPISRTYPPNLLTDGGFELGYVPTNVGINGSFMTYATPEVVAARSGRYGLRARFTATVAAPALNLAVTLPTDQISTRHSHECWVRPSKAMTVTPYNTYLTSGAAFVSSETGKVQSLPANVWTRVVLTGEHTPGATGVLLQMQLVFSGVVSGDIIDLDDCNVRVGTDFDLTSYATPAALPNNDPRLLVAGGEAASHPVSGATSGISAGTTALRLSAFVAARSEVITKLSFITGSTAATGTTLIRYGVYQFDAGTSTWTLIASTVNDTALLAAANTEYSKALSAPWNKVAGVRYALGILYVGSGSPTIVGLAPFGTAAVGGVWLRNLIAFQRSAQSDLPATITNAQLSATSIAPYAEAQA